MSSLIRMAHYIIFILIATKSFGANTAETNKAIENLKLMSKLTTYSYAYSVKNTYPNSKFDMATGSVSIDLNKRLLSEKGTYSTTVLTDKWYYKAEHAEKTISIINLEQYYKKNTKAVRLDMFFDSKSMMMPDTVFQKYGTLELFTIKNDIVTVRFKFHKLMNLDTYEIVFDKKKGIPISLFIKTYSPSYKGVVYQEFKATNFNKSLVPNCFNTSHLFEIDKNKKLTLKVNKNYKPHFEL
jgi:hypothetical protein